MTRLPDRFVEDRSLRNKARAVLADDIARLQEGLGEQGIASRVSSGVSSTVSNRIRTGARDVLAQAKAQAGDSKGVLALLIGAVMLWFARAPIFEWFEALRGDIDEAESDPHQDAAPLDAAPAGDSL